MALGSFESLEETNLYMHTVKLYEARQRMTGTIYLICNPAIDLINLAFFSENSIFSHFYVEGERVNKL